MAVKWLQEVVTVTPADPIDEMDYTSVALSASAVILDGTAGKKIRLYALILQEDASSNAVIRSGRVTGKILFPRINNLQTPFILRFAMAVWSETDVGESLFLEIIGTEDNPTWKVITVTHLQD